MSLKLETKKRKEKSSKFWQKLFLFTAMVFQKLKLIQNMQKVTLIWVHKKMQPFSHDLEISEITNI